MPIEPYDHENEDPPLPDIGCTIDGHAYYFELGEITDEGLAKAVSVSVKTGEATGCSFSEAEPLLKMFRDKCGKVYTTNGAPVDLLLYYSRQTPYGPVEYIAGNQIEIDQLIRASEFARVWVYSDGPPTILWWKPK